MKSVNCLAAKDSNLMHQVMRMYDAELADAQLLDQGISVDDTEAIAIVESGTSMENYASALSRLNSLKRRLITNETLRFRYAQTMKMTTEKGCALPVLGEQLQCDFHPRCYLPHHAVLNPKKPEKLRIVLDCAVKHKGQSLNDTLYQGPDTIANLVGIILRFRKVRVAVTADIEEMFMQVKVPKHDRGALTFLWWPQGDPPKNPEEYQLKDHPFGATSSLFCANFALNRAAREFGSGYGRAVLKAIEENVYVDDCLALSTTCDEALRFTKEITELLGGGGFKLRRWSSNSPELAESLSEDSTSTNLVQLSQFDSSCQRALACSGTQQEMFLSSSSSY
ncbi:unnamed protein product [Echinostoma caproni]|uniref:Reverse transcriptase domain-containing protein n=1 Tax=Echinostoma caproni TaxID=27848 RepID=A0A182ZZJ9_9TREM|nr:unnamed protein product [Echinostoma caproni]